MSHIFLFGGGPSLKGFDFKKVENYPTLGINKSFLYFPTTYLYFMDVSFLKNILEQKYKQVDDVGILDKFNAFKGQKFALENSKKYRVRPDITYLINTKRPVISYDINSGIYASNNSGYGALMLAIALGYMNIYLLGYDLSVSNESTHYHCGYHNVEYHNLKRRLERFIVPFNSVAPALKKENINVFNLNPKSALNCFPKITLEEALKGICTPS